MVGWYHRLNGHEFEKAPGVGDGQGDLAGCSPWGRKKSDITERLNRKTSLQDFKHILTRVGDECNCPMVSTFLSAILLWNWDED